MLSLNGFHAFPDKEAAYREVYRVLKPGGTFCGCFYVQGKTRRTDWFIKNLYTPKGFFTPAMKSSDKLYDVIAASIRPHLNRSMNVRELACGPGTLSFRLAGSAGLWEATDFSKAMIQEEQKVSVTVS